MPVQQAAVTLAAALIPGAVGLYIWWQRGRPGAALSFLLWIFALWGAFHAAGSLVRGEAASSLHTAEWVLVAAASPLWLTLALQYTGRERWLTPPAVVLLWTAPAVALALELAAGGAWLWVDLTIRAVLAVAGSAFFILMLVGPQRLYALQSLCLLAGFLAPWSAATVHQFFAANPYLPAASLAIAALAPALALRRYRLLDISPVAHDAVVEGMSDGTIVLDARYRIVDLNPAARRILGCETRHLVGHDFREVVSGKVTPLGGNRSTELLRRCEQDGQAHEEISLGEDGTLKHYELALSTLHGGRGRTGYLVVLHEITARKQDVERLDKLARYDSLTRLPNRAHFYERLSQEIARSHRKHTTLGLFLLDLDRFKSVNDALGHGAGDLLLKEVARRLTASVREYDVVSRLSGDEFTVILPEVGDVSAATAVAERIVAAISEPFEVSGNRVRVTTSVGICLYPNDGADPNTLVKNADRAMYRAKSLGKNRYELFAEESARTVAEQPELADQLAGALERGELSLFYQPALRVATSRMCGVEALLRWEHPERGIISPQDLLPLARETGLIFEIERWAMLEACNQMRSWQERYPTGAPLTIGVNISGQHFMHPNLIGEVSRALEKSGLPPPSLVLEVKESTLSEDAALSTETLRALREIGVKVAVDDFGVGTSSLSQLKRFPLDVLKIDRSFVAALPESAEDRRIVSAVISLAHAMGLEVAAVGVQTAPQLMQLKEMGCDIAQGRYFAEPLSRRATSAFLVADLYY